MEEEKHKIRICLMIVVVIAVIVGMIYYVSDVKNGADMSEGTLVKRPVVQSVRQASVGEGEKNHGWEG